MNNCKKLLLYDLKINKLNYSLLLNRKKVVFMKLYGFNQKIYTPIREIAIQTPKKFEETIKDFREVSPFPLYSIEHAVASEEPKYTQYANTCAILGMSNGKKTYLGHFAPENHYADFKSKLERDVKKMQDETGQLSAFVTGGYDYNVKGYRDSKESFEQLAEIGEVLDKAGASITMLAGKEKPVFKDNMAVTPDRFILSHSTNMPGFELIPDFKKCMTKADFENTGYNYYRISEIDEAHNIYFEG